MARSIFALELCARLDPALRAHLHGLLRNMPAGMSAQAKFEAYRAFGWAWRNHLHLVEKGCWDFFDDHERATRDFTMWTQGMTTEEGARTNPSGVPDAYRGEPRYMTFTAAFLLEQGSYTERALAARCAVPKDQLWSRATFGTMVDNLAQLNFGNVEADVVYLIPGDDAWGLTLDDLAHQKFQYLRQVT